MDSARAKRLFKELAGKTVSGWKIEEYINHGKSAVVFKGSRDDVFSAIKVFDPELIERYGAEVQLQRIQREKSLVGKKHPYLVEIFDGGQWKEEGLFYVIMEYLPWKNLAEVLLDVPVGLERQVISQIASAAQFLEGLEICHRDIKPENIGISVDFQNAKLLDLGVIKPQKSTPITDETHAKIFVGTIKYSPPEFLLREEKHTVEGWRAITFYQLGAVLHDLIMRRPLFADFESPIARLINAVQYETPSVESKSVSPTLVELARYCLLKAPSIRLELINWRQFEEEPASADYVAELKSRIFKRTLAKKYSSTERKTGAVADEEARRRLEEYSRDLESICRLESVESGAVFPPVEIHSIATASGVRRFAVQYEPSTTHGLVDHLRVELTVRWLDLSNNVVEVVASAFVSATSFGRDGLTSRKPLILFRGVYSSDTVRRKLGAALYSALDQAQQTPDVRQSKKSNRKAKKPVELALEQGIA